MIDNDMGLGACDSEYENVKILDRKASVPDGKYTVQIVDVTLDRDQKNNPRLTLAMEIEDGDYAGTVLAHDSHFYDSKKLEFLKKAMIGLGLGHIKPSEFQRSEVRASIVGARAEVSCVTKTGTQGGSFLNIYINRRLDLVAPSQPARPAAPVPSKVVGSIQPPASKPAPFDDSELPF